MLNELVLDNRDPVNAQWAQESLSYIHFVFAQSLNIEILPSWLGVCHRIQLLNLSDNRIKDISILQKIVTIKQLILKGNQIQQIDWKKLKNLQRLDVSHNNLKNFVMQSLPESLLEIDLGDNSLQKLNLQSLPLFLRKIDVFGNEIKGLLFKSLAFSLEYLDLSYNKLQNLDYFNLSTIKVLYLNSNNLTAFKMSDMHYLQEFSISENKLKSISIKNCPLLKQLHIARTCITKLEVIDFPSLMVLSIHENSLLNWIEMK